MTARGPSRVACLGVLLAWPLLLAGQGHGPIYGLSTPTLGRGGWSIDIGLMDRIVGDAHTTMLRPMVSYGVTEDLQVSASLPLPLYRREGIAPARGFTRMPASPDIEILLGWRFHRTGTDVGARFETTTWLGVDYPTDAVRGDVRTAPGLVAGVVTGYASRTIYAWVGGLYRRSMSPAGPTADHPADVLMYSLVLGYRPRAFRADYPKPDWRVFVELLGERTGRDVVAGVTRDATGGDQILIGPTLLGLYGSWGISGGPVFPVYRRLNGAQREERLRLAINTTFWF